MARGCRPWALQQVGGYLGYTGYRVDVVVTAARDPNRTPNAEGRGARRALLLSTVRTACGSRSPRDPPQEVKDRGVCLIQAFQNDQAVVRLDLKSVEMVELEVSRCF
jgi:hypothetical protein